MSAYAVLLTCEHGGARVPRAYQHLFESKAGRKALGNHRGADLGALRLARSLARMSGAPLHANTVTRLLVDLNRSLGHPRLFSEFSRALGAVDKERLLDQYYLPHRNAVSSWIDVQLRSGHQVLHLGVHSFSPRFNGRLRTADVGLLYDPARPNERSFCGRWKEALGVVDAGLRVRRNYPYLGKSDGFTTYLRKKFNAHQYLGIELEVNQSRFRTGTSQRRIANSISGSLREALLFQ